MREIVAITGASAGVGRATAHAFARRGAAVGLIARDSEALYETAREVERLGGRSVIASADVADADQVEAAAERIETHLGPLDVWVNDAMTTVYAPFDELTPLEFRRATEVTYLGCVHGTMAALARMKPRDRGAIVQVGSALSYRAIPLQSAYCGAKFAIRGFTDSLRSELLHDGSGIRLTMVQLPAMNTPQFDWGRNKLPRKAQPVPPIFQPEVAARAIVFASCSRRREVWVGRSTVVAILANKLCPGLLDHMLGSSGYTAQESAEAADRSAPDNLFQPVAGAHATHGRFDSRAERLSLFLELSIHKWPLLLGGLALVATSAAARRASARRRIGRRLGAGW